MRRVWQKRGQDPSWCEEHPHVSREILEVQGPLAAIAGLQDQGYRQMVVQPLHIYAGEEYQDLLSYLEGLNSIRTIKPKWMPFHKLVAGRPALGEPGPGHPYHQDLTRAARALERDVREASEMDAALVYVGHGNHLYSSGVYLELQQMMRRIYPERPIWVGTVEGLFGVRHVLAGLLRSDQKKVVLRPLMVVAGGHSQDDIGGPEEDSWKSVLQAAGLEVICRLQGLGENPSWADIYVEHIRDAAQDHQMALA
jgi:sirohydrochlorin cobaltochelatase